MAGLSRLNYGKGADVPGAKNAYINGRYLALALCLFGSLTLHAAGVYAGQDCGERAAPTAQALARGLQLGQRVREQLESSGASMALVGRIGLNLSEFGQRYSHLGVALRDHVRNRWQVVHLFNPCGKAESEIQAQPVEKFFETDLFEYEALVVVPSYTNQGRMRNAFMQPASATAMHQKAYNLIAHPFRTDFQNSNQWILEMMTVALDSTGRTRDRAGAQRWLQAQGFAPAGVRIPNTRRTAARLFSPHVRFSDHTQEEYEKQTYLVVTVESITRFLSQVDPGATQQLVR